MGKGGESNPNVRAVSIKLSDIPKPAFTNLTPRSPSAPVSPNHHVAKDVGLETGNGSFGVAKPL